MTVGADATGSVGVDRHGVLLVGRTMARTITPFARSGREHACSRAHTPSGSSDGYEVTSTPNGSKL